MNGDVWNLGTISFIVLIMARTQKENQSSVNPSWDAHHCFSDCLLQWEKEMSENFP